MSFDLVGYGTPPVEALCEARNRNRIISQVLRSSVAPVGFGVCSGVVSGLGAEPDFLRDALIEWPAEQEVRTFYLVKWRLCDDPEIREKIEVADREVFRRNQDRLRITESLRVKRTEKACILAQLKTLDNEDNQLERILDRKELEDSRKSGLCSSEEELDKLLTSVRYCLNNCSRAEERRLTREIKRLELTREKVKSHDAMRAWILEMSPECTTRGQVTGEALEEVRKKQEAVRENIKHLDGELEVVEGEIKDLESDLADVIVKRDKAYMRIQELRKQCDDSNGFYYRNRAMFKDARALAATNNVVTLEELAKSEVENFFSLWNSDRRFRDNYERRIQPSLVLRGLGRDGRRRGLGNRLSAAGEGHANSGTGESGAEEDGGLAIINMVASLGIVSENADDLVSGKSSCFKTVPTGTSGEAEEADDAKLKLREMRREEEMAKAKKAMERKKKLAERHAAKAAIRAQKEAEKKLKEQEKKARKKALALTTSSEQADNHEIEENVGTLAQVKQGIHSRRDKFWRRHQPSGSDPVLQAILRRRRPTNQWLWAVAVATFLAAFGVLGSCLLLRQL